MDFLQDPAEVLSMASLILLTLLSAQRSLELAGTIVANEEAGDDVFFPEQFMESASMDMEGVSRAALQHWRLWNTYTLTFLDEDLVSWVEPRSTTWFSRFLLHEYEDDRWVQMFRMTKCAVMSLAHALQPAIQKSDTNYRYAIPVVVRLACTLFKLSQGASLLVCSDMFGVGRRTVSIMLRDVVHAINVVLRSEISWPSGERLRSIAADFYELCGLPGVVGAIDGTHISICKPKFGAVDYYHFKTRGYSMNCQAVVDSSKRFLDFYVGMPGSTHDSRMLRRSSLYSQAQRNVLWDAQASFEGFTPYLLGDSGYPLRPWIMVPHKRHSRELSIADTLFNKKLCQGRGVVENAFALLKQSFKELQGKSELSVVFLPDVVICCALLHNTLLQQSHEDVERLMQVLCNKPAVSERPANTRIEAVDIVEEQTSHAAGVTKRRDLGLYLAAQHIVPL